MSGVSAQQAVATSTGRVVVVAGATGYIGKNVVAESVRRGHTTIALVRDSDKAKDTLVDGAQIVQVDVTDREAVLQRIKEIAINNKGIDTIISCLASRTAGKKQVFSIDYQATLNCLDAGRANKARHFVLVSAFCVLNPQLELQKAKLKFEAALQEQQDMTWTIVRPTAFFKSISGQVNSVKKGSSFVAFGDGETSQFNPISEQDLAEFVVDSAEEDAKKNKIFHLGGPGGPFTLKKCGEMIFKAVDREKDLKYIFVPLWLLNTIITVLQFLATITRLESMANAAETARLVRYYATQDMLTTDPSEIYGSRTLQDFYNRVAQEGEEYDPNTHLISSMMMSNTKDDNKKEL